MKINNSACCLCGADFAKGNPVTLEIKFRQLIDRTKKSSIKLI
jgi:hypothetical protein